VVHGLWRNRGAPVPTSAPPFATAYASTVDEIGLFPLELVLLPGERMPLHIFEPRYKELIGGCIDEGADFGLVLADEAGMRAIGTRASVVAVLERFDDGRLNIVVEGGERFHLVELTEGRTFMTGEVDSVSDEDDDPSDEERESCLAAYRRLVDVAEAEVEDLDADAASLAYEIAARIELGTAVKQELLELRSERDRVLRLSPLLAQAAEALSRDREVRERASGNGRVEAP
jgi:Lon protease-like protein